MTNEYKDAIVALRSKIKSLETKQINYKSQRKTVNFKGERTLEPWKAQSEAHHNKFELRLLYAAYGLLRGKTYNQIENSAKPINVDNYWHCNPELNGKNPLYYYAASIENILNNYGFSIEQLKNEEKRNISKAYIPYSYKNSSIYYEEVVYIGKQKA